MLNFFAISKLTATTMRVDMKRLVQPYIEKRLTDHMSGHAENSRAFSRYREIDREIKTNAVNLLD